MSTVSTHVLDTGLGLPARGVPVQLTHLPNYPPTQRAGGRAADQDRPADRAAEQAVNRAVDQTAVQTLDQPADRAVDQTAVQAADRGVEVGVGTTDDDGRVADLAPDGLEAGTYRLRFDVAAYAVASGQDFFFPEVSVTFTITDERHYHVPLLLSPYAFSTYRGS
ncbi:hypothetical protein GCM10009789_46390 [Kribbella sancticallisti]|uniref:hydroxyisourate hydrolase n=1 Tax=Kribbella sancticallisti TaxID=460087 RepID=A0ABN2DV71_9ACTN